jgi:hypothetical protein
MKSECSKCGGILSLETNREELKCQYGAMCATCDHIEFEDDAAHEVARFIEGDI